MRPRPTTALLGVQLAFLVATPLGAQAGEEASAVWSDFQEAVGGGRWWLKLRYRYEDVDQEPFARDAGASTLRTVLGYETGVWNGASVLLELEDVSVIGSERYDSTINGLGQYPVVADPEGSEVNQVFLRYAGPAKSELRVGRQVLSLDNTRFVGDVAWRQNQQTFDALAVEWKGLEHLQALYAFVENVNRVFGQDSPQGDHRMASHLLNAGYDLEGWGRITGYAYLLDYDSVDALSRDTYGLRLTGKRPLGKLGLEGTLEAATQSEAGDNPNEVDQTYFLGELGATCGGFGLKVGHETLGGSGAPGDAFQTPLATLHTFNGWADKFLTTPDAGLVDLYVTATQGLAPIDLQLTWHVFESDAGSADYGDELDASLVWKVAKGLQLGLKLADYDAEDFATDTTKAWVWLAYAP